LPGLLPGHHFNPRPNIADVPVGDFHFGRFVLHVESGRPDQAIEVARLDLLRVNDSDVTYADVRELLADRRAAAPGAYHKRTNVGEELIGVRPIRSFQSTSKPRLHATTE